jgi:hypothetical protein
MTGDTDVSDGEVKGDDKTDVSVETDGVDDDTNAAVMIDDEMT